MNCSVMDTAGLHVPKDISDFRISLWLIINVNSVPGCLNMPMTLECTFETSATSLTTTLFKQPNNREHQRE
jgi:hypothetical protein